MLQSNDSETGIINFRLNSNRIDCTRKRASCVDRTRRRDFPYRAKRRRADIFLDNFIRVKYLISSLRLDGKIQGIQSRRRLFSSRGNLGRFRRCCGEEDEFRIGGAVCAAIAKHKFAYYTARDSTHRSRCGSARAPLRPTANSIRIAAAVQKHSIRNKPALPACLPARSGLAPRMLLQLVAFQFVRPPIMRAGIEDQL